MARVAGTPEAKRAWIVLRGPYAVAYLLLVVLALVLIPGGAEGQWWRWVAGILGAGLLVGSLSSYMVVSKREPQEMWRLLEALEVSGLRIFAVFQIMYGVWLLIVPRLTFDYTVLHWMLAAFAIGVLANMSWRKGVGIRRAR